MELLVHFGVPIVMLLVVLSVALSYLSGPIAIMRRLGVGKAIRWMLRSLGHGAGTLLRWAVSGTQRRIRRAVSRALTGPVR